MAKPSALQLATEDTIISLSESHHRSWRAWSAEANRIDDRARASKIRKKLEEEGLIEVRPSEPGDVKLTREGRARARSIAVQHSADEVNT